MPAARVFDPWIGPRYESEGLGGLKLLVLGESHYGAAGTESREFTQGVVRRLGQESRHRYFTTVAKLALGLGPTHISNGRRAEFWDRVAFSNYVQSFVAESAEPRARPTEEMWAAAREPLTQTLEELRPDALLITGLELGRRVADLPGPVPTYAIKHPSQFLNYDEWQPGLQAFLASVRSM